MIEVLIFIFVVIATILNTIKLIKVIKGEKKIENMKKMKIIDLLNLKAIGKALPKKIEYYDVKYVLGDNNRYYSEGSGSCFEDKFYLSSNLNEEITIIDEQIEPLIILAEKNNPNNQFIYDEHYKKCYLTKHNKIIANKLNEVIYKLNELKENQDE